MKNPDDESRFERSKMSFGQHLEELRSALFKSIAALIVFFLVGLAIGQRIVDYIQKPLRESLQDFYLEQAEENQRRWAQEMQDSGQKVPDNFVISVQEMAAQGLIPQRYFLSPTDLAALAEEHLPGNNEQAPAEAEDAPLSDEQPAPESAAAGERDPTDPPPPFARKGMISLRIFLPIEEDPRMRVVALNSQEPFAVYIRTSFLTGAIMASPFIFYFVWQFVAAGLYRQEQNLVYAFLPVSIGLFVAGALIAFFFAFKPLLGFLLMFFKTMHIDPGLRLSEWISFVLLLPLGFGVSFQLPLVMLLLERIGIFTVDTYWRKWRAAVVVIAIIAMLLTPSPDPYSMLLMAVPLTGLYFAGIWMCRHMPGGSRTNPRGDVAKV